MIVTTKLRQSQLAARLHISSATVHRHRHKVEGVVEECGVRYLETWKEIPDVSGRRAPCYVLVKREGIQR